MKLRIVALVCGIAACLAAHMVPAVADLAAPTAKPASWTATPAKASPELKAAWEGYYKALDEMRQKMENTSIFENPQNRAKMYHALMEEQAMAYNFIIAPRMTNPRLLTNTGWQTDTYTLGGNGPDFYYGVMFLDGTQTYRVRGRMGDIKLFLIQVQNNVFGEPGNKTVSNFDVGLDADLAKDGTFEVIMGGQQRARNWIPLDSASGYQFVIVRRALMDWGHSDKGEFHIDRISAIEPGHYDYDEFDEKAMAQRIHRAELFIRYLTDDFNIGLYDFFVGAAHGKKNAMSLLPGTVTSSVGSPSSQYALGTFSLQDDEALILELDKVPNSAYWSYQLYDEWARSLPFNERQTGLNSSHLNVDKDGHIRVVISKQDPGVANWLDTAGRHDGQIVLRNYRTTDAPVVPKVSKVKFDRILAALPKGTAMVTPDERAAAIEHRRQGLLKLYGE